MQAIFGIILIVVLFALFLAIFGAIAFGIALAFVYGLMWLLNDVVDLPYVAASSAAFVVLMVLVVFGAIGQWAQAQEKLVGFFTALYSLLVGPIMYAAAFNAHRVWTHADVGGDTRYLPGEYWGIVSNAGGWVAAQVSTLAPATTGVFQTIENSSLLTGIVSSAFTALVFTPMARGFWGQRGP
jgi:hypothetical protein